MDIENYLPKKKYLCKDTIKPIIKYKKLWINLISQDKTTIRQIEDFIRFYNLNEDEELATVITYIVNDYYDFSEFSKYYENLKIALDQSQGNEQIINSIISTLKIEKPEYDNETMLELKKKYSSRKDTEGRYLKQTVALCLKLREPFLCNYLKKRYM